MWRHQSNHFEEREIVFGDNNIVDNIADLVNKQQLRQNSKKLFHKIFTASI